MTEITKQKKELFGTNGVRGVVGEMMTPELVMNIGMALASMRKGTVAVGRDTRTSGAALCAAVKAGLLAGGCNVVDLGILPTPALQYIVKDRFIAGAVITASHNPPQYNGVKIIDTDGTEMGDEETIALEKRVFGLEFDIAPWEKVGTETDGSALVGEYIKAVSQSFTLPEGHGTVVAADPGSGAACETTPAILTAMGCRVFTVNAQMDGHFPGRMPEPSPEGLHTLSELVRRTGAAFGIAHDGDADRAVFVDEKGNFIDENEEFALMERFICSSSRGTVVTPVSTSLVAEDIAACYGCSVDYTPVGSIYVARRMISLIEEGQKVVFGGEGNGGLIFPSHQFCRDGAMTAAAMVALLAAEGRPLSEIVSDLPRRHMIREKIHTDEADYLLARAKERFESDEIDVTDGVRINRAGCWALLRPSGTEPFMRLYAEAKTREEAEAFRDEIMAALGE